MRKFAFSFVSCMAGVFVASAFAQPRDLFAEFEAEAAQSVSSSETASSSSVAPSSSSVASSSAEAPAAPASSAEVLSSSSSAEVSSSSEPAAPESSATDSTSAVAAVDSAVADSSANDSLKAVGDAYIASMNAQVEESRVRDSLAALSSSSVMAEAPSSSSMSRRDLLGPVKVSKVHGIDEMKGKYKSPRKALFLSLVIPGSGQLYVGGSTFTYVRGGVYLALEAALWGSWGYFSVHKYNEQVDKYKKFARKHYSIGRYEIGMRDLYKQLSDESEESRFENRYMSSREDFCEALYGSASSYGCYVKGKLFTNDKNHMNKFADKKPLGEELESLKDVYDKSVIYQEIADDAYVLGWDDVQDQAIAMNLNLETDNPSNGTVALGSSSNMKEYRSMRSKANEYADMQAWFFGGIILNHIVSAVDAAFTANSHNKALYSEDVSWYDRLHFDSYMNVVDGLDVGVQASWGF